MPHPSGNATESSRLGRVGGVGGVGRCPIHAVKVSPKEGTDADLGRSLPVGGGGPAAAPTENIPSDIDADRSSTPLHGWLLPCIRRSPRRRTNANCSRPAAVVAGQLPDRNWAPVAVGVQTAAVAAAAAAETVMTAGWIVGAKGGGTAACRIGGGALFGDGAVAEKWV